MIKKIGNSNPLILYSANIICSIYATLLLYLPNNMYVYIAYYIVLLLVNIISLYQDNLLAKMIIFIKIIMSIMISKIVQFIYPFLWFYVAINILRYAPFIFIITFPSFSIFKTPTLAALPTIIICLLSSKSLRHVGYIFANFVIIKFANIIGINIFLVSLYLYSEKQKDLTIDNNKKNDYIIHGLKLIIMASLELLIAISFKSLVNGIVLKLKCLQPW